MDKKPHPIERAWAAGWFTARGRFPTTAYTLRVEGTDKDSMARWHEIVGVGSIIESIRVSKKGDKATLPNWVWQAPSMDTTRETLLLIAPFMTGIKKVHAAEMIAKVERNPIWQKKHPTKASSSVTFPATSVAAGTTARNTQVAGSDALDAEQTGK